MRGDKYLLSSVQTLTFYKDKLTQARRTDPIPQLTCSGKACNLFQPEAIQCTNMGDDGSGNVQWKCDTDLPSSLRLGQVEVSCEGWSKPGDRYVLKGSCGLQYDLIQVNRRLEDGDYPSRPGTDWAALLFGLVFFGMLFVILYSIVRSFIQRTYPRYTPPPLSNFWPGGGGGCGGNGGGGNDGGPGFNGGAPPPPYTKDPQSETSPSKTSSLFGPNLWTTAAAGAAGYALANARNSNRHADSEWDRFRTGQPLGGDPRRNGEPSRMGSGGRYGGTGSSDSPGLGEMRQATGFGGSNVR